MKTPGVNQQPITEKSPSEPVVSCSKDPGVSVEGQEQSRYSGWHTEILPEIGESEEVSFNPVFTFVVGIDDARQGTMLQLVPTLWWA